MQMFKSLLSENLAFWLFKSGVFMMHSQHTFVCCMSFLIDVKPYFIIEQIFELNDWWNFGLFLT